MAEKKSVGLNPQSQIHYTEHLAPMCIIMGIPLIFLDEHDYNIGTKYYPGLQPLQVDYSEFNPEFLIANFDVTFMSDMWDRYVLREKFGPLEKKYNKILRNVHVPHGFSNKGFYIRKCANEDITLIYGQNMIDLLKSERVFQNLNRSVITGNFRYTYYKMHQQFYDKIMKEEVLSRFDKPRPIILYAPTWLDLEESTTFFDACSTLIDNLPADFNLIIKLHPRLELDDTAMFYHLVGKYENKPHVLFLNDFPLVFPLLQYTDIYIGDMSSIGYDLLPFNKPMYFLNKQRRSPVLDRALFLYRCGIEVKPENYHDIYKIIDKTIAQDSERFSQIRSNVYEYSFGPERPFEEIKAEIIQAYSE